MLIICFKGRKKEMKTEKEGDRERERSNVRGNKKANIVREREEAIMLCIRGLLSASMERRNEGKTETEREE